MTDDRKFATAKMNKPIDSTGKVLELEAVGKTPNGYTIRKIKINKYNFRKLLYIFLTPLLLLDWIVTLLANIIELICNSIKEVALHLETYINNADSKSSEPET